MEQQRKNKEFVTRYFNSLSGVAKTKELVEQYVSDEALKEHIAFFDRVFPNYTLSADEMTAEDNRVVVRGRCKGRHEGELNGISPTNREVDFPFAIGYEIENDKIINHWLIADQMTLMEQLGVMNVPQE